MNDIDAEYMTGCTSECPDDCEGEGDAAHFPQVELDHGDGTPTAPYWYTIVASGELVYEQYPLLPHDEWNSAEEAEDALQEWIDDLGPHADEALKLMNVRVVGPYRTREKVRDADIATAPIVTSYPAPHRAERKEQAQ